ncbi:MAG: patatin-like phospholipase family protein [Chromatiales bacterium]|nr:patatin-like phospholipase family protein [Chromatiales bacterium]
MTSPPLSSTAQQSLEDAVRRHFDVPDQAAATMILAALEPRICRGGDWLFRQGDAGDAMYLLARGRLQAWLDSAEPGDGGQRLIAEIGPGEIVGEIGMLAGGQRSAGIRAVRDSLLLRMDGSAFDQLGRQRPELIRHIAGGIAARLRDRTAGPAPAGREVRTIALVPLDGPAVVESLVPRLLDALAPEGPALLLTAERMRELGAPVRELAPGAGPRPEISPELVDWLATQEDRHRFIVYVADAGETAWSDLALRHADLIVLVANAAGNPGQRPWERAMLGAADGPVARRALVLLHGGAPETLSGTAAWLEPRHLDFHLHVRDGVPGDFHRLTRVLAGKALGLVLGGGAARGIAHLGVYQALTEAKLAVDWVGGASIGAVMAASIAQGTPVEAMVATGRRAFLEGRPFSDVTIPLLSLLRGRRMEKLIREYLTGDIEDLPLPFFCVSSNLGQGTLQVHDRGPLGLAVRASAALPGVYTPAVVNGQLTIDGGILDNLPVDLMRRRPVGRVVAVDVTSRNRYEVDYDAVPSPWAVLAGRYLPFARRYRVPGFMSLLLKATEIGTMADVRAAGQRADLLIRPPVSRFSLTDVRAFDEIVRAGYEHGQRAIAEWQAATARD